MCSFSDVICRYVTYDNVKSRNIDHNIKPLSTGSSGSSRNARYSRRQQVGKLSYSEQIAWSQILDASCRLHPGSTYVTLSWVFPHNLHFSFSFYYYYYYYYYIIIITIIFDIVIIFMLVITTIIFFVVIILIIIIITVVIIKYLCYHCHYHSTGYSHIT